MNRLLLCFVSTSYIFLMSCQYQEISSSYPFLSNEENFPVIILFSNDHYLEEEYNYYDALIDFQQNYPNKLSTVNIVTEQDQELIDYYEISIFPTLLLTNDLKVELRIEGSQDLPFIYNELELSILEDKIN